MKTGIYTRSSVIVFSFLASADVYAYDPVPPAVANKLNTTAYEAFNNLDASNYPEEKLDTENDHVFESLDHHQSIIRTHMLGDQTTRFLISPSETDEAR